MDGQWKIASKQLTPKNPMAIHYSKWLVQVDGSKSLHGKMVVEPTHESENMRKSNWIISPRDQGENMGTIPPIDTHLRICVFPPGVVSNMFCRKIPKELDPFGARQNSKEKNED